ncbi:SDR family oxidoreductase [Sphingobacterium sp. SRCM116780]|uniref:SDR family oxidoreductase n=1 Tax=Sphingobacterium sp. SRCM116780 TaxID=2907623 RepID=UPI001F1C5481|nr:SDR family oxidoreductase [Sphingobacterium sp. SRCM116780]UIR54585.1 SDR family oxidoreductase [Sphingobacterium sp. SRCM116780]
MQIDLTDKKALVGASSGGIGAAIAQQLALHGATVTLMARNEEKLIATLATLDRSRGQQHQYLVVDFDNYEQYLQIISTYFKQHVVDILINNTPGPKAGTIAEKTLDDYQKAFELLFKTHCYTTELALPHMKESGYGRIIHVSSLTVKEPVSTLVLSNTVRTALMSWSKSLAKDVASYNITVNNVLTGLFDTARIQSLTQMDADRLHISYEEALALRLKQVPMNRLGKPEEYGYLVSFICSEYANYLTGTNIPLDGGMMNGF